MTMCKSLIVSGAVIGFISCVPTSANAEPRASLNIADHDGIYVDGRSFKVIPGTASGDASAVMRKSGARELGPAAIVFRKGDKLYLATVPPSQQSFGSDRRDYGSDRDESPSTAQSEREWREWQQSLRQNNNRRDYGSDRYAGGLDQQRLYVNDPDYAEYRLRKFFDENWTAGDTK
jgi:hypothetical protein